MKTHALSSAALVVIALICATGCPIKSPPAGNEIREQALPSVVVTAPWRAGYARAGTVTESWVESFGDDQLVQLVREAMAGNPDLRVGATRIEQAAGYARLAGASRYPTVNLAGRGSTQLGDDMSTGLSGGLLSASWEIDLWGRLRYGRAAAEATYVSVQSDFDAARQSLAGATARGWFGATETLLQLKLAREMVDSADQLVQLGEKRFEVGAGDGQSVARAHVDAASYRDTVTRAAFSYEQSVRALELLLGRYPAAELEARSELPGLPGAVPAGLPLEMLERRPDLVAAERRVASAFDRVGEAKAARLPRLSLTGSGGYITSTVLELKDDFENPVAGLGASLLAPIFQGGALKTQVEIRSAEQKQAVAEYARIALRAIGEVEGALAAERALGERERLLEDVVARSRQALDLEQTAYRVGKSDQRPVVQQALALGQARAALLRVKAEQLIQRVNLHVALGGGFERTSAP